MEEQKNSILQEVLIDSLIEFCETVNSFHSELQIEYAVEKSGEFLAIPLTYDGKSYGYIVFANGKPDAQLVAEIKSGVKRLFKKIIPKKHPGYDKIDYFTGFTNSSPIPHCLVNRHFEIVTVNEAFTVKFGIKAGEEHCSIKNLFIIEQELRNIQKALDKMRKPFGYTVLLKLADGKTLFTEMSFSKVTKLGKEYFLTTIYDMTKLALTEKGLREKESQFQSLIEQSITGIFIIQKDKLKYINQKFADIFGYDRNEILERKYDDFILDSERERVAERLLRVYETASKAMYQFTGVTKSGAKVLLRANASAGVYDGEPAVIGTLTDVTKTVSREKELRESERKFKALTENAPVAILIYQGESIIYANPGVTDITEYSNEEILNMRFWELVHPEDRDLVRTRGIKRQTGDSVEERYKFRIETKSKKTKWIDFSGSLINYNGMPAGIVVATDITKSYENKEQLKILNMLLSAMNEINSLEIDINDLNSFFSSVANILDGARIFRAVWIGMYNESAELVKFISNDPEVEKRYSLSIENRIQPPCIVEKIKSSGLIQIDSIRSECKDCLLYELDLDGTLVLDEFKSVDKRVAVIGLVHEKDYLPAEDEKKLISEFTSSISSKLTQLQYQNDLKNRNIELLEIQEKYLTFFNNSSEGIYRIEFDKEINVAWNSDKQAEEIYEHGYIAECNKAFAQFYGEDIPSKLQMLRINKLYPNSKAALRELRLFIENGYYVKNKVTSFPLKNKIKKYFNNNNFGNIENGKLTSIWGIQTDITSKYVLEKVIKEITVDASSKSGLEYLKTVTMILRNVLEADMVFVGEYYAEKNKFETKVFYEGKKERENLEFNINGTPTEKVIKEGFYICNDLQKEFPSGSLFSETEAKSFIGVPLINSQNKVFGALAAMFNDNLIKEKTAESILTLVAGRMTAELERIEYENQLRISRNDLAVLLDSTLKAFILLTPDYKIKAFNRLANNLYMLLFNRKLSVSADFLEFALDESEAVFKQNFYRAISGGNVEVRKEMTSKTGSKIWVQINYEPAKDKKNKVIGVVYSFENITEKVETEQKLSEESALNSLLMSNTSDGIHVFDFDGNIIQANEAFARMLGYDLNEIIGRNIIHFAPRFTPLEYKTENYKNTDTFLQVEYLHKNGKFITLELSEKIIELHGKKLIFRSGRDITEKIEQLNEIKKLSAGIEQSSASIMITDFEGKITYVNKRFCEVTGYTSEMVIGESPGILKSGEMEDKDYKELWETILSGETWTGEFCNRKRNGELFWELASISPIRNNQNEIISFIAVKEDITERKALENQLKESERKLEAILHQRTSELQHAKDNFKKIADRSEDLIIQLDGYRNILYLNKAANSFFTFKISDYTSRNIVDIPFEERTKINLIELLDRIHNDPTKVTGKLQTGKGSYLDITIIPEIKDTGSLISYTIFGHEVTEHIKTQEKIKLEYEQQKELNKLRSEFFAMVSHDLRTPLTVILSNAELLEQYEESWDKDEIIEQAREISASVNELLDMMEDMMIVGKSHLGRINITRHNVSIDKLLDEVIRAVSKLDYFDHKLDYSNNTSLDKIYVDKRLMKRVLGNLLSNAAKYSEKGSEIKVEIDENSENIIVRVVDEGIGINSEDIPELFEVYFRAKKTDTIQGSGLGLAVAKKAIEEHGGDIMVESRIDQGSRFIIFLPKAENLKDEESFNN